MRVHSALRLGVAILFIGFTLVGIAQQTAYASDDAEITQQINAGVLTADIRDASRASVASPTFAMNAANFSFDCQQITGSLGTNSQRLYIDNPDTADAGWTLTIAVSNGATALWENSGATQSFDYNDPTGSACDDGGDADSKAGQLTIDASAGTLSTDCETCTTSNISKGTSAAFSQGSTDSITLLTAAAGSDDIGRWYLTGVGLSQSIPGQQPVDSYSIDLTITVTAS